MVEYRHLRLKELGVSPATFKARRGGGGEHPPEVGDRESHADKLSRDVDAVADELPGILDDQAEIGLPANKRGMLLAFEGREEIDLLVGDGRSSSRGVKVFSVRRRGSGLSENSRTDLATVFVTQRNLDTLRRQLANYREWRGTVDIDEPADEDDVVGDPRPRGFSLFETTSLIRSATLRDCWGDSLDKLPRTKGIAEWEIWIRKDLQQWFLSASLELGIVVSNRPTSFVEVAIYNVAGTPEQLQLLIRRSAAVVELRSASQLGANFAAMPAAARTAAAAAFVGRLAPPPSTAPRVAVLDSGIDASNPLLAMALPPSRCFTVGAQWGPPVDHSGHGTNMAGIVQFIDLEAQMAASGPVLQHTSLESVVVQAPPGTPLVPARQAVDEAVKLLEAAARAPRVYCLAQTARGEASNGTVTATSGALDLLAFGDGRAHRLFCVAAGNVPFSNEEPYQVDDYANRNERFGIESPGQAFNVITVGAITRKIKGPAVLVAPDGDMSPTSRSASGWNVSHPSKPDIVLEGGNFEIDDDEVFAHPSLQNSILTTGANAKNHPLAMTGQTSAATARAAGLLGRAMGYYDGYWPESLRGMLIHSADWTPAMRAELQSLRSGGMRSTQALRVILGRYGWGVPDEQRLYTSTEHQMTMVVEDTIKPFALVDGTMRINEMKYLRLPWPRRTLAGLRTAEARLKCTLSYFVEPDPHAAIRDRYDRYASARLKFDVKRRDESHESAQSRFNSLADTDSAPPDDGWELGSKLAMRGAVHQDVWTGPAFHLAEMDGLSVMPVKGWWSDIRASKRYDRSVRFALIVTLVAPAGANLLAEVMANLPAGKVVESPTAVPVAN